MSRSVPVLLDLPDIPLRTASFALEDRWLLWARARLYVDRLVLSGWGLCNRYWRRVPLGTIEEVQREGRQLTLHLENGNTLSLLFSNAGRWSTAIRVHRTIHEQSD
jgi:hypothetical protein